MLYLSHRLVFRAAQVDPTKKLANFVSTTEMSLNYIIFLYIFLLYVFGTEYHWGS